jgi:methionyl-tRNA formyltransferase
LAEERLRAVRQDESLVTQAPKLTKEHARLDWTKSATALDCQIRGTYPAPGPFTFVNGERIKIHRASVVDESVEGTPGEVIGLSPDSIYVQTGAGVLQLEEVQPASRNRMSATDFARGHKIEKGISFRSEE